jgi:hypothetical protein
MKRWLLFVLAAGGALPGAAAAEEAFSKAVRPQDFSAAGLGKLSPDEIARLDRLVRDYKSGALEAARREAEAASRARAEAEARAAKAEAAAQAPAAASDKKPSLLERAKVKLTPGTEIEYATVESRIAGEFRGWEGRTVFTLENGQRWQANASDTYVTSALTNPAVKITPGALGSFWMTVEGVKPRVRVTPIGGR